MSVKPIPDRYHPVTPYLTVQGASKLIEFVKKAFQVEDTVECMTAPDGTVMHAEFQIGDSIIMVGEACGESKPMPTNLYHYVTDVDATYKRALQAGGTAVREPEDQFYGDRSGGVKDPCGNVWWIATHVEDVAPEEMEKRAKARAQQAVAAK